MHILMKCISMYICLFILCSGVGNSLSARGVKLMGCGPCTLECTGRIPMVKARKPGGLVLTAMHCWQQKHNRVGKNTPVLQGGG